MSTDAPTNSRGSGGEEHPHDDGSGGGLSHYWRFGAMIATSTVTMFVLTYTNAFAWDHVRFSEERLYMAVLMGAAMALIMLGFMWKMMYSNTKMNLAITGAGVVVFIVALLLSRTQVFVDETDYMKAMIPHHSIAILTSERADIDDVRVRRLADEIIEAQRREIAEMDWLINDIDDNGEATTEEEADQRPVPEFSGRE